MWYAAGLLNSLGTWGGVCFHSLWWVVVVIYKYRSLLSTVTHTHTHKQPHTQGSHTDERVAPPFCAFVHKINCIQWHKGRRWKVSRFWKVFQERKNVSTEVRSPRRVLWRTCSDSPQVPNVKRAFHSQSTYFPLFLCVKQEMWMKMCPESSVIYSMKKSILQGGFPVVLEDRRVPWTYSEMLVWTANGEAGEKPEVSSLHESPHTQRPVPWCWGPAHTVQWPTATP